MFFIGIMGVGNKEKPITNIPNITCKACGGLGQYTIIKRYSYFHIFFIPLWKWNVEYYVKERMCQTVFALKEEVGENIEKGLHQEILSEHIQEVNPVRRCKSCGGALDEGFIYCPYCSSDLNTVQEGENNA